jgi:hypothetical protein
MQHGLHESHASSYLRTMERGSAPNVRKQVWVGRSERTMTAPFKASGPGAPQLSWSSRIVAELGQLNPGGESPPNAIVRGGARRGKAPGVMLYFFRTRCEPSMRGYRCATTGEGHVRWTRQPCPSGSDIALGPLLQRGAVRRLHLCCAALRARNLSRQIRTALDRSQTEKY